LQENSAGLEIDRVGAHDILYKVTKRGFRGRHGSSEFYFVNGNACNPMIRQVSVEGIEFKSGILGNSSLARRANELREHDAALLAARLIVLNEAATNSQAPPQLADCGTRFYLRTHPQIANLPTAPPLIAPPQTQVFTLGAQRQVNASEQTQIADLHRGQDFSVRAYAQAADLGARQGHHTPVQTQFTGLGVLQALVAPPSTQVADMSISARRVSHPAPLTRLVAVLDRRQALPAPPPTPIADLMPARHLKRAATITFMTSRPPGRLTSKHAGVAITRNDPWNRKSVIASAL
jgi:hypothetical protein